MALDSHVYSFVHEGHLWKSLFGAVLKAIWQFLHIAIEWPHSTQPICIAVGVKMYFANAAPPVANDCVVKLAV